MSGQAVALVDPELLGLGNDVPRAYHAANVLHEAGREAHPAESSGEAERRDRGRKSLRRPELLERVRVARQREHVGDQRVFDTKEEHLVELERSTEARSSRHVESGGALVALYM